MNRRRDNFIEFIYHNYTTIKDQFFPIMAFIIALIGYKNQYTSLIKIGFYVFISLVVIYSLLKWYNKTFEFNEDMVRVSQGVFRRKHNDIPISRIKSIHTTDSLLKRLFRVSNLSLELIGGGNVKFVLSNKEISEIKKTILFDVKHVAAQNLKNKFSLKEYFLLSFINKPIFLGACSLSLTFLSFLLHRFGDVEEESTNSGIETINEIISYANDPSIMFTFVMTLSIGALIIFAVAYVFTLPLTYLAYGNFQISSDERNIDIEYGLLNNKKYHIPKHQIRSLRVVEPLILRWFGYVQLKVDNIGMSSKHSSVILYPVIRRDQVDDILNSHLQEFELQPLSHRPNKASALGYILIPSFKFLMVIGILMFLWIYSAYLLLFLPIVVLLNLLKWKYSALSFNDRFITIRYGKGLRVVTLITHKKYVETTSVDQTILMKRKRTIHYMVALYSEQLEEVYCVKYLRDRFKKMFMDYNL